MLIFNAPFGIMGLSDAAWGALSLPADLGPVGMPGCSAFVSVDDIQPLVNTFGNARWQIGIPYVPNLVGADFYLQGLVVDPPANAFGAVVTNALECTIGAQ